MPHIFQWLSIQNTHLWLPKGSFSQFEKNKSSCQPHTSPCPWKRSVRIHSRAVASRVEAYALAISIHPPITWCFSEIPPPKNGHFNVSRWFHHYEVGIYVDYRNIIFNYKILNALRKSLQFKNIQEYLDPTSFLELWKKKNYWYIPAFCWVPRRIYVDPILNLCIAWGY